MAPKKRDTQPVKGIQGASIEEKTPEEVIRNQTSQKKPPTARNPKSNAGVKKTSAKVGAKKSTQGEQLLAALSAADVSVDIAPAAALAAAATPAIVTAPDVQGATANRLIRVKKPAVEREQSDNATHPAPPKSPKPSKKRGADAIVEDLGVADKAPEQKRRKTTTTKEINPRDPGPGTKTKRERKIKATKKQVGGNDATIGDAGEDNAAGVVDIEHLLFNFVAEDSRVSRDAAAISKDKAWRRASLQKLWTPDKASIRRARGHSSRERRDVIKSGPTLPMRMIRKAGRYFFRIRKGALLAETQETLEETPPNETPEHVPETSPVETSKKASKYIPEAESEAEPKKSTEVITREELEETLEEPAVEIAEKNTKKATKETPTEVSEEVPVGTLEGGQKSAIDQIRQGDPEEDLDEVVPLLSSRQAVESLQKSGSAALQHKFGLGLQPHEVSFRSTPQPGSSYLWWVEKPEKLRKIGDKLIGRKRQRRIVNQVDEAAVLNRTVLANNPLDDWTLQDTKEVQRMIEELVLVPFLVYFQPSSETQSLVSKMAPAKGRERLQGEASSNQISRKQSSDRDCTGDAGAKRPRISSGQQIIETPEGDALAAADYVADILSSSALEFEETSIGVPDGRPQPELENTDVTVACTLDAGAADLTNLEEAVRGLREIIAAPNAMENLVRETEWANIVGRTITEAQTILDVFEDITSDESRDFNVIIPVLISLQDTWLANAVTRCSCTRSGVEVSSCLHCRAMEALESAVASIMTVQERKSEAQAWISGIRCKLNDLQAPLRMEADAPALDFPSVEEVDSYIYDSGDELKEMDKVLQVSRFGTTKLSSIPRHIRPPKHKPPIPPKVVEEVSPEIDIDAPRKTRSMDRPTEGADS